jgi:hypothetical protein
MLMKKFMLFGIFFSFLGLAGYAQDVDAVTDEELAKYAKMEVEFSNFLNSRTEEMKSMIIENEIFQGGARYNELKAAWGDEAKLAEAKVTEEEKAAYIVVQDFQDSQQEILKEFKTDLIMDEEVLGASTYNKVLAATKEDPALKSKLDGMIEAQKAKEAADKAAKGDG